MDDTEADKFVRNYQCIQDIRHYCDQIFEEYECSSNQDAATIRSIIYKNIAREKIHPLIKAAQVAADSFQLMYKQHTIFREQYNQLKDIQSELSSSREEVKKLKDELLVAKTEQLATVSGVVKETIENEIRSYASVVGESQANQVSTPDLRSAVQSVVQEEERSHNLMLFGLQEAEEGTEDTERLVGEVLFELGEKPHIVAERVGRAPPNTRATRSSVKKRPATRPVKVCLSSPALVRKILSRARELRDSSKFSRVFICPDRSSEQRVKQRNLVQELKKRKEDDPRKTQSHYIRGGTVHSERK